MYREEANFFLDQLGFPTSGYFPTFEKFVQGMEGDVKVRQVLCAMEQSHGMGLADRTALYIGLYANLIVRNSGVPTFCFRDDLVRMLRDTEFPGDIDCDLLRLPYEGIIVHVPRGTFGPPGNMIEDIYLTLVPDDRFRVVFPLYDADKTVNYISFIHAPGMKISDGIKATMDFVLETYTPEFLESMRHSALYTDYFRTDVFNLALNASLYLGSPDSDIRRDNERAREIHRKLQGCKKRSRRQHLESLLKKEKEHKIYIVGSNTRLPREYTAQFTEEGKRASLSKRFRVRGHWRNQAYGPAHSERRARWIAPYWKGPTLAEMLARNYVVGRRQPTCPHPSENTTSSK